MSAMPDSGHTRSDTRTLNLAMDFSLRVGEMLLANGAGAADVAVTIRDLARHLGVRQPEIDVTFTVLSMSYQPSPEDVPLLQVRQVRQRDIDYEDLTMVDHLVRDVLADRLELKEARAALARIVSSGHNLPRWAVTAGWGVLCAAVATQLGGNLEVALIALLAAAGIDRLQRWLSRRRVPFFYQQVAGGFLATILAVLAGASRLDVDPSLVVTANIVMLLAGIGLMGALQDALSGFYVTAAARILEALLATAGIIAGVSAGLTVGEAFGVEISRLQSIGNGWDTLTVSTLGAALSAGSFAFASYAPTRVLLPIAGIAGAAMVVYQSIVSQDLGRTWAAGTAAFLVGLVSYAVAGRVQVPPLVVVVSAIVPMLPGLSIYHGLSALAEGGAATSDGLLSLMTAASVAIALASGVILGEYVAQPLRRNARRLENRLSGPRLVGSAGRQHPRRRPRRSRRRVADSERSVR